MTDPRAPLSVRSAIVIIACATFCTILATTFLIWAARPRLDYVTRAEVITDRIRTDRHAESVERAQAVQAALCEAVIRELVSMNKRLAEGHQ